MTDESMGAFVRAEIDKYLDEHNLKLVKLEVHDEMMRRTICLNMAIQTKGVAFSLSNDASVDEVAEAVVIAAKRYESYVSGA
jgi:hypothetical protein